MSVAYSSQLGTVCVLNGGSTNGVACFSVSPTTGLSPLDASPRSVSPALNQTTPPLGPLSTASDLRFNPSGTALFASIKGTPATNSTGAIYAWPVSSNGTIGTTAVVSVLPNIVIDFSMTFIGKSDFHMMLTAPGLGAAILGIDSTLAVSVDQYTNITGSAATCWGVYGASERLLYAIDALKTNITVVNPNDGSVLGAINYVTNATGFFFNEISKSYIYTLTSSATSVININLRNEMQVQEFFPAVPNPGNLTSPLSGMAFWGLSQKY